MKTTATPFVLLLLFCWCTLDAAAQRPELPPGHPLQRIQETDTQRAHPGFRAPSDDSRPDLGAALVPVPEGDIRAIQPPALAFDPPIETGLEATVDAGETTEATFALSNIGAEPVEFSFVDFATARRHAQAPNPLAHVARPPAGPRQRGAHDHGAVWTPVLDAGGPDDFGYSWIDSDSPDGPQFELIDIRHTGTQLALVQADQCPYGPPDEGYASVSLPFSFPFYGQPRTQLWVSANGFVAFQPIADCTYGGQPLPSPGAPSWTTPGALIAPLWSDFDGTLPTSRIQTEQLVDGRFVIQWTDWPLYSSAQPHTFQLILHPGGAIKFQYLEITTPWLFEVIGQQNDDATDGLLIAMHSDPPYPAAGKAVLISAAPAFITAVSPSGGVLAAGQTVEVTVTFDASSLFDGTYEAGLSVQTDEIDHSFYSYPVKLIVIGEADCVVSPNPVDFGEVIVGASGLERATVTNVGTAACTLSDASIVGNEFSTDFAENVIVPPTQSVVLDITFAPAKVGPASGLLTIETDGAEITVGLQGVGLAPPIAAVDPDAMAFELPVNATTSATLSLSNLAEEGAAVLTYSISTAAARPQPVSWRDTPVRHGSASKQVRNSSPMRIPTSYRTMEAEPTAAYRGNEVVITHSASQTIMEGHGIMCFGAPASIMRVFDLATFGLSGGLNVTSVDIGVEAVWQDGVTAVRLHRLTGPFTMANLTLLAEVTREVTWHDEMTILNMPVSASFAASDVLVVEWYLPTTIFYGGNNLGQTAPTYFKSDGCGFSEPIDLAQIGFDWAHWVLNVRGSTGPPLVSVSPSEGAIIPGGVQELTVTINTENADQPQHEYEIHIQTNDPSRPALTVPVSISITGIAAEAPAEPLIYALQQNYPNPFARGTTIAYSLSEASKVRVEVFDALGRRVATLVDAEMEAGRYSVNWDVGELATGSYFYRITAGGFSQVRRAVVLR